MLVNFKRELANPKEWKSSRIKLASDIALQAPLSLGLPLSLLFSNFAGLTFLSPSVCVYFHEVTGKGI